MKSVKNPYESLPLDRFWKTGVAERDGKNYVGIWKPRFDISKATKFCTAGSCFAQHISKWLQSNGYHWIDSEPAPSTMPSEEREAESYGIFSCRTGNIYSAALLKQWVFWALGVTSPADEVIEDAGRYFDPFRPLIPKNGYASQDGVIQARQHTLQSIRQALQDTDIFIFTLGLTEGWMNLSGHSYPLCPGTVRGEFDEGTHKFINYDSQTIERDLNETFDAIRSVNPSIRFLLTVSPVPLTATASEEHVLVATTYSKSVLRAVAGSLKASRPDVDYFPSYELISAFPIRGRYYEDNLRSVKKDGVEFVMSHFGRAIGGQEADCHTDSTMHKVLETTAEDILCEEVLLETWISQARTSDGAKLCLIGDSHMGMLSKTLTSMGIGHSGGMIMSGSAWHANVFHLDPDEYFVPLLDKGSRSRWTSTLGFFEADESEPAAGRTIITNLCMHTHVSVPQFLEWFVAKNSHLQLNAPDVATYFRNQHESKISIMKTWMNKGYRLIVLTDPPTQQVSERHRPYIPAFEAYEMVASKLLEDLGCQVFNARLYFRDTVFLDEYYSSQRTDGTIDWIHGSEAYYAAVASALRERYALS